MDRDIFDDMKIETGCTYISDLPVSYDEIS